MHFPTRFHSSTADVIDRNIDLKPRDFMGNLFKLGNTSCVNIYGDRVLNDQNSLKECRNEIMVAASCVLLNKTNNNVGDARDNVYLCRHEINLSEKKLIEKFGDLPNKEGYEKMLQNLSHSTHSFC